MNWIRPLVASKFRNVPMLQTWIIVLFERSARFLQSLGLKGHRIRFPPRFYHEKHKSERFFDLDR